MTPLPPGTACVLNDGCPWPERRGLLAVVVNAEGAEHQYPVHGLTKNEVVVHISEDPLERPNGAAMLPNGVPWSCVVTRDCLTPLADIEGDMRPHLRHWETDPDPASPLPHPEGEQ
jgi:hypothetical protein